MGLLAAFFVSAIFFARPGLLCEPANALTHAMRPRDLAHSNVLALQDSQNEKKPATGLRPGQVFNCVLLQQSVKFD
jgi:hypothetical protein